MTPKYGAIGLEDEKQYMLENIIVHFNDFAKFLDAINQWSDPNIIPFNYCVFLVLNGKYLSEPIFTNETILPDVRPSSFLMGFQNHDTTIEISRDDIQRYLVEIYDTVQHCDKNAVGVIFRANLGIAITTFDYMVGGSPN